MSVAVCESLTTARCSHSVGEECSRAPDWHWSRLRWRRMVSGWWQPAPVSTDCVCVCVLHPLHHYKSAPHIGCVRTENRKYVRLVSKSTGRELIVGPERSSRTVGNRTGSEAVARVNVGAKRFVGRSGPFLWCCLPCVSVSGG